MVNLIKSFTISPLSKSSKPTTVTHLYQSGAASREPRQEREYTQDQSDFQEGSQHHLYKQQDNQQLKPFIQQPETEPPPPYSPPLPFSMSVQSDNVLSQTTPFQLQFGSHVASEPPGNILLDLRGVLFDIPKEELLRLPESILLGISNGLLFDNEGSLIMNLSEARTATVNFSPDCLKYTLDMFRSVSKDLDPPYLSIDSQGLLEDPEFTEGDISSVHDTSHHAHHILHISDVFKRRPAIIVLREDLDYYCLPAESSTEITAEQMHQLKIICGKIVVGHDKIFSGLRKADDSGSPEHHLVEMLCSSGFHIDDTWGFRAREPNKTVISSLALVTLKQTPEKHEDPENDLPTAHKLLLFWRKPARKCWWDSLTIDNVEGCKGPLRVHIRRVWTLELSVLGVREI